MIAMRTKLIVASVTIAMAVGILAFAGVREGWVYFLPVDEYLQTPSHQLQRVRLHGTVSPRDFEARPADLVAQFDLMGETSSLRVEYRGVIPDLFEAGVDVVVEGRRDEAGLFRADTLLTKCASKYETGDGQAPHAEPHDRGSP